MCALVSNIAGRLSSTNTGSLLPTFSYLYCFLSLSSAHCTDRGKRLFLLASSKLHLPLTLTSIVHQETAGINSRNCCHPLYIIKWQYSLCGLVWHIKHTVDITLTRLNSLVCVLTIYISYISTVHRQNHICIGIPCQKVIKAKKKL